MPVLQDEGPSRGQMLQKVSAPPPKDDSATQQYYGRHKCAVSHCPTRETHRDAQDKSSSGAQTGSSSSSSRLTAPPPLTEQLMDILEQNTRVNVPLRDLLQNFRITARSDLTVNNIEETKTTDQYLLNDADNDIHHLEDEIVDFVANYCNQWNSTSDDCNDQRINVISSNVLSAFVPCSASRTPPTVESVSTISLNPDLPYVQVTINDVPATILLDSRSTLNVISRSVLSDLKLTSIPKSEQMEVMTASGSEVISHQTQLVQVNLPNSRSIRISFDVPRNTQLSSAFLLFELSDYNTSYSQP